MRPGLHVLYRSYGGENVKGRPDWYSKLLALTSFVRAVEDAGSGVEVLYVNDGPIPAERTAVMEGPGAEVLRVDRGSNRGSLRWTLSEARRRSWPAEDLVLLLEDDYLFVPDALTALRDEAERRPDVDYFAVYGFPTDEAAVVGGWAPFTSTTSSFAVRARALREDHGRLTLLPFTGGAFDHTTCLAVQGRLPFTARDVLRPDPPLPGTPPAKRAARRAVMAAVRLAAQASAVRRPSRRRRLYGPVPALATHMEVGVVSPGRDWPALAAETRQWWAARPAPEPPGGR